MSEIPEDIMSAAEKLLSEWGMDDKNGLYASYAGRLAANERERCLSIVRNEITDFAPEDSASDSDHAWTGCAEKIEALMRQGPAA